MVDSLVKSRWMKCKRLEILLGPVLPDGSTSSRRCFRRWEVSWLREVQMSGRVVVLIKCWAMARDRPEEEGEQRVKFAVGFILGIY